MHKKKLINLIENKFKEDFYAVPIGTIFSFVSANPPPGAFVLNGQIISNCRELFPDFWNWLISESTNNNIRVVTSATFESELSSCGNCGAFIIDTNVGSVRLPSITTGFIQGTNSNIGNSESAGLPNITGQADIAIGSNVSNTTGYRLMGAYYSGAIQSRTDYKFGVASGSSWSNEGVTHATGIDFDASRSSSIYGNSNTVQPNAVHYSFCIQVYNSTSKLSTAIVSEIISELQGKAGINLENLTANGKSIITNVAGELDYENRIENLVENTGYLATTNGILSAYGSTGSSTTTTIFYLVTWPPNISNTEGSGHLGYRVGAHLPPHTNFQTSYNLFVPKGWTYYVANSGSVVTNLKFIPFKNSN